MAGAGKEDPYSVPSTLQGENGVRGCYSRKKGLASLKITWT